MDRVLTIQEECLADDLTVDETMVTWSDDNLRRFFESGGTDSPASHVVTVQQDTDTRAVHVVSQEPTAEARATLHEAERFLAQKRASTSGTFARGWLRKTGSDASAAELAQRCMHFYDAIASDAQHLMLLGELHFRAGGTADAVAAFEQAAKLIEQTDSDGSEASERLARLAHIGRAAARQCAKERLESVDEGAMAAAMVAATALHMRQFRSLADANVVFDTGPRDKISARRASAESNLLPNGSSIVI